MISLLYSTLKKSKYKSHHKFEDSSSVVLQQPKYSVAVQEENSLSTEN